MKYDFFSTKIHKEKQKKLNIYISLPTCNKINFFLGKNIHIRKRKTKLYTIAKIHVMRKR